MNPWRGRVLLAAALAISTAACGGAAGAGSRSVAVAPLDPGGLLGPKVMDLDVQPENVADRLAKAKKTYVDALALFSLRRGGQLMATLQVSRLGAKARIDDPAFRRSFVSSLGGTEPRQERLGDRLVWLTTGTDQRLSIWFAGRDLMVLAVRNDYERPRGLLRTLLAVQP